MIKRRVVSTQNKLIFLTTTLMVSGIDFSQKIMMLES